MFAMLPIRGVDAHGSGAYGAPRANGRVHNGVDLACYGGTLIPSPVFGEVTKVGLPYNRGDNPKKAHFRYVEVKLETGEFCRFFYLSPLVEVGNRVTPGDLLGEVQGWSGILDGMTDHCHVEVFRGGYQDREYLEPVGFYQQLGVQVGGV